MSRLMSFLGASAPSVLLAPASPEELVDRFGFHPYLPMPGTNALTDGWPVGASLDAAAVTYRVFDKSIEISGASGAASWPAPTERAWRVIAHSPIRRWVNFIGMDVQDGGEVDEQGFLDAALAGRVVAAFICPANDHPKEG